MKYRVWYYEPENPLLLAAWIERIEKEEGVIFVSCTGNYYIFRYYKRGDQI